MTERAREAADEADTMLVAASTPSAEAPSTRSPAATGVQAEPW